MTTEGASCAGVEASKGMRVRKSAARLAYVEENGWDDLSAGGDGTLISILVTCPLNPKLNPELESRGSEYQEQLRLASSQKSCAASVSGAVLCLAGELQPLPGAELRAASSPSVCIQTCDLCGSTLAPASPVAMCTQDARMWRGRVNVWTRALLDSVC